MNSKGTYYKVYNENPILSHIQPYPSNVDSHILTNNHLEENNLSNSNNYNHFGTPVVTPYYFEEQTYQNAINEGMEIPYYTHRKQPGNCLKSLLLVMSILMFIFLISEYFILSSINMAFKNIFIIIDDLGIFIIAIIFLISFILSIKNLNGINSIVRSIMTVLVWFVGFVIRGIGNMSSDFDNGGTLFALMGIRAFIMFFAIPVSFLNNSKKFQKI